jgi:hypothetical protein
MSGSVLVLLLIAMSIGLARNATAQAPSSSPGADVATPTSKIPAPRYDAIELDDPRGWELFPTDSALNQM